METFRDLSPYVRLMRLEKPIGSFLLMAPTLWALWIAGAGQPDPLITLVFVAGVFITRSAGCVINDLTDKDIDGRVARTSDRPLAAGQVSVRAAMILAVVLGLIALGLLSMLRMETWPWAVAGAAVTIAYPRFKRFFPGAATGVGRRLFFQHTDGLGRPGAVVFCDYGSVMSDQFLLDRCLRYRIRDVRPAG